jgi:hypothetical protein
MHADGFLQHGNITRYMLVAIDKKQVSGMHLMRQVHLASRNLTEHGSWQPCMLIKTFQVVESESESKEKPWLSGGEHRLIRP